MKLKPVVLLSFFILYLVSTNYSSAQNEDGSLDEIQSFAPENKYFKANLKSLHFIIETSPSERIEEVFSQLIKANKLPIVADNLSDGTFTGESPYDAFDYKHVAKVSLKNGKIVDVDYNEIHKNGQDKFSDKAYNKKMMVSGTCPEIAYPIMEKQLLEKQKMMEVDAVSGASSSLYRFRYSIMLAFIKASLTN